MDHAIKSEFSNLKGDFERLTNTEQTDNVKEIGEYEYVYIKSEVNESLIAEDSFERSNEGDIDLYHYDTGVSNFVPKKEYVSDGNEDSEVPLENDNGDAKETIWNKNSFLKNSTEGGMKQADNTETTPVAFENEDGTTRKSDIKIEVEFETDEMSNNFNITPTLKDDSDAFLYSDELKCDSCDYSTIHKSNLKRHIDSLHFGIKKFQCESCDYASLQKYQLRNHVNAVHVKLQELKCHLCEFIATQKSNLKIHKDTVHLMKEKFQCDSCDYCSPNKSKLKNHMEAVHLKLKNFKCHLCEFSSSQKSNLKKHIDTVHLRIRKFQCGSCNYVTSRKNNLDNHVESVHVKLKTHHCKFCDYITTHKNYLKRHISKVHTRIKK